MKCPICERRLARFLRRASKQTAQCTKEPESGHESYSSSSSSSSEAPQVSKPTRFPAPRALPAYCTEQALMDHIIESHSNHKFNAWYIAWTVSRDKLIQVGPVPRPLLPIPPPAPPNPGNLTLSSALSELKHLVWKHPNMRRISSSFRKHTCHGCGDVFSQEHKYSTHVKLCKEALQSNRLMSRVNELRAIITYLYDYPSS